MDERETALIDACLLAGIEIYDEEAEDIIKLLRERGFDIIHRGENHGPTLERAAVRAENLGGTWTGSRDAFSCVQEAAVDDKCEEIASAIRAMGEKK